MSVKTIHGVLVGAALIVVASLATLGHSNRVGPDNIYPPAEITGVTNPAVTQANIQTTICTTGYTATIRPTATYTTSLKQMQMSQFNFIGSTADYEEDHFISLELGGNPTDPKNLWPEKYPTARNKDQVEDFLHTEVCNGSITLAEAQKAITTDWYAIYQAGKAKNSSSNDPSDI